MAASQNCRDTPRKSDSGTSVCSIPVNHFDDHFKDEFTLLAAPSPSRFARHLSP
jgi:hypothetical protein